MNNKEHSRSIWYMYNKSGCIFWQDQFRNGDHHSHAPHYSNYGMVSILLLERKTNVIADLDKHLYAQTVNSTMWPIDMILNRECLLHVLDEGVIIFAPRLMTEYSFISEGL